MRVCEIDIPTSLEKILIDSDENYDSKVKNLIENTHNYFTELSEFFPGYTFHGKKHINNILKISAKLIPEDNKLTARDAAIYISAVMVHDIGMFITSAGFKKLFLTKEPYKKIKYLDNKSWSELWEEYGRKLKRYTSKQLLRAFGTAQNVKIPDKTKIGNLEDIHKLICGEFLRQNHGRLAQDVVLYGFLGESAVDIFRNTKFTENERELIGVIARSHTMKVRDTEDYLNNTFGDKERPDDVPAIYLMCLLRLSDYIDADKNRAPNEIEKARGLQSQISRDEWEWNQAVDRYTFYLKKDLLKIYASPERSTVYVKIKNWIDDVQHELDKCHALLAEYYENEYTLSIHRVTSDILNKKYASNLDFVTKEAKLTANPDITKLLIAPLYGNEPSYGVRELIQNATDACSERKEIEKQKGKTDYKGKVTVRLSTKDKTFTITDNGIGMNEDIIINYYLVAGSSYRSSQTWQDKFAPDGNSVITRGGKFGVGFLATFLLGDTVEVTTRHIDEDRGYHFTFNNESDILDIERVDCEIGTTITVKDLKDRVIENFTNRNNITYTPTPYFTDWYGFKEPAITYYIDDEEIKTNLRHVPDETDDEEFENWITIPKEKCAGLDCVKFRYHSHINLNPIHNEHFYNGIRSTIVNWYSITKPFFSLIDKNNIADIDLARKRVKMPREICNEVDKYFWADILILDEEIIKTTELSTYGYDLLYSKYGYKLLELIDTQVEYITVPILGKYIKNIYPLINKCNGPFMLGEKFSKKLKSKKYSYHLFKIMLSKYDELKGLTDGSTWIPYNIEERKKKFPKTFEELAPYIDAIEKARKYDKEYQDILKKAKNGEYPDYPVELYEKFMSLPEEYKLKGVEPEEIDIILQNLNKNK
ncbi:MAG: ATP-binding protein [Acutalibacteraceae bacterium]